MQTKTTPTASYMSLDIKRVCRVLIFPSVWWISESFTTMAYVELWVIQISSQTLTYRRPYILSLLVNNVASFLWIRRTKMTMRYKITLYCKRFRAFHSGSQGSSGAAVWLYKSSCVVGDAVGLCPFWRTGWRDRQRPRHVGGRDAGKEDMHK